MKIRFQVSGVSPAVGLKNGQLDQKETIEKRISNNEYRMSNVEVMYSVYFNKD
jgi:hypothetical protein